MCLLKKITLLVCVCVFGLNFSSHAQFLKKLKDKVNNAVHQKVQLLPVKTDKAEITQIHLVRQPIPKAVV